MDTNQIAHKTIYISLPRGSGKTNCLIIRSSITGFPMVVRDRDMKRYAMERAEKMNTIIPEPITFHEYKEELHVGRNINGLLFDDYKAYSRQYGQPKDVFGPPIVEAMM